MNEARRKSSVAARRPSTAGQIGSAAVVKDLRHFRRPSTASALAVPEEWASKRRLSNAATCERKVQVDDLANELSFTNLE